MSVGAERISHSNWRNFLVPHIIYMCFAIVGDLAIALGWLHIPPGFMATGSSDQVVETQVLSILAWNVASAVIIFGVYYLITFRERADRQSIWMAQPRTAFWIQTGWLTFAVVHVLFAAGYGTAMLEGQVQPNLVVPASAKTHGVQKPLVIQVIGQQWQWTYRYPQFGGFETQQLRMPEGRLIQFDVTSLDVIHSFWAYQLGVKIDANPGVNNVGYAFALHTGVVDVHCAELCGIWHGYMTDVGPQAGRVLSSSQFASWVSYAKAKYGPEDKYLPKYAPVYYPQPLTY